VQLVRRARLRQRVPQQTPRAIPDNLWDELFAAMGCHRDRALLEFYVSSGARASELLRLTLDDIDWGGQLVYVVSKGSRLRQPIPASPNAFRYMGLYLAADGLPSPGQPIWRTRRGEQRPMTYWAMRRVLQRANKRLGTNPYGRHLVSADGGEIEAAMRRVWPGGRDSERRRARGARLLLAHLNGFLGEAWQQRWEASGLNKADQPINVMIPEHQERKEICTGAACLFALRVIRPSLLALRSTRFAGYGGRFLEAQGDPQLEEFWKRVQEHRCTRCTTPRRCSTLRSR
jgi:hypothetical protein